jgi:hypothetical protein
MPTTTQNRDFKSTIEDELIPRDFLEDIVIPWINRNLEPDDVFDEKDLKNWAENNGYIKE